MQREDFQLTFGTRPRKRNRPKMKPGYEYVKEHPEVYQYFDRFTRQALAKGFQHLGSMLVMQRIRWFTAVEKKEGDDYKVNHTYAPFFARLWMKRNPGFIGFFRLNPSHFDSEIHRETVQTEEQIKAIRERERLKSPWNRLS